MYPGLDSLSILCRESAVISSSLVKQLAPPLARTPLTRLAIAGCPKINDEAMLVLLRALPQLKHLALEATGVTAKFFGQAAPSLAALRSLKLTHPGPRQSPEFLPALLELLDSTTELESFTLYHSGASSTTDREWVDLEAGGGEFIPALVERIGAGLRKLELSNVLVTMQSVEAIAAGMPNLRDLVFHLSGSVDIAHLSTAISQLSELRTLHLLSIKAEHEIDDILSVAQHASSTLRQIGYRNRVWTIRRVYEPVSTGGEEGEELEVRVSLERYDSPHFPGWALVVRT